MKLPSILTETFLLLTMASVALIAGEEDFNYLTAIQSDAMAMKQNFDVAAEYYRNEFNGDADYIGYSYLHEVLAVLDNSTDLSGAAGDTIRECTAAAQNKWNLMIAVDEQLSRIQDEGMRLHQSAYDVLAEINFMTTDMADVYFNHTMRMEEAYERFNDELLPQLQQSISNMYWTSVFGLIDLQACLGTL